MHVSNKPDQGGAAASEQEAKVVEDVQVVNREEDAAQEAAQAAAQAAGQEASQAVETPAGAEPRTGDEDTLKFATDEFSPYVVVLLEEISTQVITADGEAYIVTVAYDADSDIPEDAVLDVH